VDDDQLTHLVGRVPWDAEAVSTTRKPPSLNGDDAELLRSHVAVVVDLDTLTEKGISTPFKVKTHLQRLNDPRLWNGNDEASAAPRILRLLLHDLFGEVPS